MTVVYKIKTAPYPLSNERSSLKLKDGCVQTIMYMLYDHLFIPTLPHATYVASLEPLCQTYF